VRFPLGRLFNLIFLLGGKYNGFPHFVKMFSVPRDVSFFPRAGSPPTASEMVRRYGQERGMEALRQLLYEWEQWSADLLEVHLSYPVLAYLRPQHDTQSWLAALTAILDSCALVIAGVEGACQPQAELTFAMARHGLVDLSITTFASLLGPELLHFTLHFS
jgi:hypothetical protein